MSEFNFAQALDVATATLKKRKQKTAVGYVLYYSNNGTDALGKMYGNTLKEVIAEFRTHGQSYQYAMITRKDSHKVIRFFNRKEGNKFYAINRIGKSKK